MRLRAMLLVGLEVACLSALGAEDALSQRDRISMTSTLCLADMRNGGYQTSSGIVLASREGLLNGKSFNIDFTMDANSGRIMSVFNSYVFESGRDAANPPALSRSDIEALVRSHCLEGGFLQQLGISKPEEYEFNWKKMVYTGDFSSGRSVKVELRRTGGGYDFFDEWVVFTVLASKNGGGVFGGVGAQTISRPFFGNEASALKGLSGSRVFDILKINNSINGILKDDRSSYAIGKELKIGDISTGWIVGSKRAPLVLKLYERYFSGHNEDVSLYLCNSFILMCRGVGLGVVFVEVESGKVVRIEK